MSAITARRFTVVTAVVLMVLLLSRPFLFLSDDISVQSPVLHVALPAACQIWPGHDYSQDHLNHTDCDDTILSPLLGDVSALGNPRRCLEPGSRLDQYYYIPGRNWFEVRWGHVQTRCAAAEYKLSPLDSQMDMTWRKPADAPGSEVEASQPENTGRTAVVLRSWDTYEYTDNRLAWLRALIAEVSLQRVGRYQIFLLVHVKNPDINLEEDDAAYEQAMRDYVPEEFREMAFLFNERTLKAWYPLVEEHGAQDQMYQALQIFSQKFQQYDYVWQLEMDLRFTGHVHDTLESASTFTRAQPRRNLWERNGRFFIPALHNNSYENFVDAVDTEIGDAGVWGPALSPGFTPKGPQPPSRTERDWGIGEDADLITFMPIFDPVGTEWIYEGNVNGFAEGLSTPRRAAVVSVTRSSRRLLQLVSDAQRERGQWVVSESILETFALLHGLKAVAVPQPIIFTEQFGAEELDANIHKGPPHSRAGGEYSTLLYSKIGFVETPWWDASYWFREESAAGQTWQAYKEGRPLPPMLLHPVKER
ncbi:Uu.00g114510.m01.CDS01 [Anthostomella pinea]|uniref:Uu.00g114510.m01.CDS01 n=1 Tax=Anthostomella pinea TaxID=933095 RepID=A0AAI8VAH6_9PEZI|nr:Uu.00g114510.m01.CDS01 [Anthostomella pinea]